MEFLHQTPSLRALGAMRKRGWKYCKSQRAWMMSRKQYHPDNRIDAHMNA